MAVLVLAAFTVLACVLSLWQWFAAYRFPLHQVSHSGASDIPVSVLKPLKGADDHSHRCLESWFKQNLPVASEILFGVASEADPVCSIVRELIARHPKVNARLVMCAPLLGPNAKVSSMVYLERAATHPVVVVSDADVEIAPGFLKQFVQPLQEKGVGLVNCFYALANPETAAMQWEAVAINADFWSQVLQSRTLKKQDFALGAVMALRRADLKQIGGFEALLDYLADDYQLGHRVAASGQEIALSPIVARCWENPMSWQTVWQHQLRWARTIRACQPLPYFFSVLSNVGAFSIALLLASIFSENLWGVAIGAGALFLRSIVAAALASRLTHKRFSVATALFSWLKDFLQFFIWAAALLGNRVEWRGVSYHVSRDGKLLPLKKIEPAANSLGKAAGQS